MDRDRLRAVQAPIKARYRENPAAAVVILRAAGECAGVTLRSVATALDIAVGGSVRAEGELDFRGTLGVDREAPVGFTAIRLTFDLDTDASEEQLATLLRLTERYCVVYRTLCGGVPVEAAITRS